MENNFLVTARKFRPQKFSSVVGQDHITKTLKNAIITNRLHHAYLFNGPRGVGKTTTARIFARALNCLNPQDGEPCNECDSCRNSLEGRSMDIIEIDGASNNSVDDVRKLRENAKFPPVQGRYKMYIIDEVHMLSTSAFNALLKTLEEPPKHLMFVFATTEPHKVPATIMSRCQRFDFRRMEIADIIHQLKFITRSENIEIDEQSLFAIAKKADGSMRDAESIFDQVVAFTGSTIEFSKLTDALHLIDEEFYFEIADNILSNNINKMFQIANEITRRGYDYLETINGFIEYLRNLLAVKASGDTTYLQTSDTTKEKYLQYAKKFEMSDLLRIINLIISSEQQIKYSSQQRIRFELLLTRLASIVNSTELKEIINKIERSDSITYQTSKQTSKQVTQVEESQVKPTIKPPEKIITTQNKIPAPNKNTKESISEKSNQKVTISAEKLKERWNDFLLHYATSKNNLVSLNKLQVEFDDGKVIIKFKTKKILNIYNENNLKELITNFVNEFYQNNVIVEFELIETKQDNIQTHNEKSSLDKDFLDLFNANRLN